MAGEIWIPEAQDLSPAGYSGTMSRQGPPRCTAHVTVSPSGGKDGDANYWFKRMHAVLIGKKAEPHLLYDPLTDALGQYFPLTSSARALMSGTHDISHNKTGLVNIQIEFVAMPGDFTKTWKPGKNFKAMVRAIRSWGIPNEFFNPFPQSGSDPNRQSWNRWMTVGGWWNHGNVPLPESHWDMGPVNEERFFAPVTIVTPPAPVVPVRKDNLDMFLFRVGSSSPVYVSSGVTYQWVPDPASLSNIQKLWAQVGLPTQVFKADSLKGMGELVGPSPTTTP